MDGNNFSTNMGYVKLSISVLGPKDEPVSLESKIDSDNDNNILMPPILNQQTYQLVFSIYKGRICAPESDTIGKVDPFILIEFGGIKKKTKYMSDEEYPVFNE